VNILFRVDDLAHKLHAPRWIQRRLCDWLDISCGITRDELRREAAGRRITEAINADPAETVRLRQARQDAREGALFPRED
jgi:hypothetical protein